MATQTGSIGDRLKQLREARGLSLRELAREVGCTESNLRAIEKKGQVPSTLLSHRLAVALGVRLVGGKRGARESIDLGGFE
jgi:transcriptional regulator with XRE-family HTH domain